MLRRLLRSPVYLFTGIERSCLRELRLLHNEVAETLIKPSVSDITVSYLVDACGLSPATALNIAKNFTLKTTDRADSFLSFLNSYGFSQSQIAFIFSQFPEMLNFHHEKIIRPKFDFFVDLGYSSAHIVKIISNHPRILRFSLEKRIIPNFRILSDFTGSSRTVAISIMQSPWLLEVSPDRILLPNLKTLLDTGVPHHNFIKIITTYPRALMKSAAIFKKVLWWLKKIGFVPSEPSFVLGLASLSLISPSSMEKRIQFYRSLGWSEETIFTTFRKYPRCMAFSEQKVLKNFSFFLEKIKCEPSCIYARPYLLYHSFEKRIVPRYNVFCLLESKGLINGNVNFLALLRLTKMKFTDKYVTKYVDQIPDLLKVYKFE